MRRRCLDPANHHYKWYGGRGIKICPRWVRFAAFAEDMGPHPGKGWTLDRKKTSRGYFKANCRWATMATQNRNKTNNKLTVAAVQDIRSRFKKGLGPTLAKEFNVSKVLIYMVVHGAVWK